MTKRLLSLGLTLPLLLGACATEDELDKLDPLDELAFEEPQIETQFIADAYDIPSREALAEGSRYMRDVNSGLGDTQRPIDHSDVHQHRFVLHRLARAGMTPDVAPRLHRAVQQLREAALARKAQGLSPTATMASAYNHFHAFDTTNTTSPVGYGVVSYSAETSSLVVDEAMYEVVDDMWTEVGYSSKSKANFKTNMTGTSLYPDVTLSGNYIIGESYAIQISPSGEVNESYSYDESDGFSSGQRMTGGTPVSNYITPIHPGDRTSDADTITKLCTNRSSIADCDYFADVNNQKWYVWGTAYPAPIQNYHVYLSYVGTATFDTLTTVKTIDKDCDGKTDSNSQDTDRKSECFHLLLQDVGTCEPNPGLNLDGLWSIDPTSANKVKFDSVNTYWKGDGSIGDPIDMDTGTGCTSYNISNATTFIETKVAGVDSAGRTRNQPAGRCIGGGTNTMSGCIDNGAPNGSMQVVKSCIAEGSLVRLASGREVPIERVTDGDRVISNEDGRVLTVVDTTVGIEDVPMVRITDTEGHSLLLTEQHAVPTLNRGIVAATDLANDDLLLTENGITSIASTTREAFDGGVYNLTLGTSHELPRLKREETTMVVNGILVGDQRMQNWLDQRKLDDAALMEPMPGKW